MFVFLKLRVHMNLQCGSRPYLGSKVIFKADPKIFAYELRVLTTKPKPFGGKISVIDSMYVGLKNNGCQEIWSEGIKFV
jgi:hypothetical protein